MCHKNAEVLKAPRVLRGFDVKGEYIVISRENGEKALWLISHTTKKRLCRGFLPQFLGDDILYSDAVNDRTDIFLYQNGQSSNLTKEGRNLAFQPSPQGKSLAFLSDRDGPLNLYFFDLGEQKSIRLYAPDPPLSLRPFVFSPDGKYILFWTRESPVRDGGVWCLNVNTCKAERIIYFPESSVRVGNPYLWYLSPSIPVFGNRNVWLDQDRFIFLSDVKGHDSFGISTLKGEIQWVNDRSEGDKEFYSVSPDVEWVAYNEYIDWKVRLVFFSLEEETRTIVEYKGCLSCPQWSDNGVYCWGSSPTEGTGILYIQPGGEPTYCYREPPPCPTVMPVPVHYKTFDGRTIGAWLYNPEKTRVLVWLHGGPQDVCLNNFDPVLQYFALSGYAVFAPNFRGSSGYGKEFKTLNWNDLGGGDLKDVIEGISYLEREGYGPFVVAGQSYGAYLSLMVLTKFPDVCEGGVCISGMYVLFPEFASKWLISTGYVWMDLENRDLLTERSPACLLEHLKSPVLVIHGKSDQYTPLSGVEYMLQRTRAVGKEGLLRTLMYEGGHGLTEQDDITKIYEKIITFLDGMTK